MEERMKQIETERIPIWVWSDDEMEENVRKQALHLAYHPYTLEHVAMMPDYHLGYGMPIGGVAATAPDIIIPEAVGVDISCFSGDTKIPVVGKGNVTLKELYDNNESDILVYSCQSKPLGRVIISRATVHKTRIDQSLILVYLDNEQHIKCTPDHLFMMRDGSFVRADMLKENDSLMPMYTKFDKDGYLLIKHNNNNYWQRSAWLVARSGLMGDIPDKIDGQRVVIHHKDFDILNDHPSNLEFMGVRNHSAYHRSIPERNTHWQSEEFEIKRKASIKKNKPIWHDQRAKTVVNNALTFIKNHPDEFKEIVKDNGKRGGKYLSRYNKIENETIYTCDVCGRITKGRGGHFKHMKVHEKKNHKVVKVEFLLNKEDVYCLNVPVYENFALSAGVFVHNCGMDAVKTSLKEINREDIIKIVDSIKTKIPVGFNHHTESFGEYMPKESVCDLEIVNKEFSSACKQIGTLGSGNHFIELQKGSDGYIWAMIHSGSRNLGKKVADYYIAKAVDYGESSEVYIPKNWELAYLDMNDDLGKAYFSEMTYCMKFAEASRRLMMHRVEESILEQVPETKFLEQYDVNHNYARVERHYDTDMLVHRKGATAAFRDQIGIIPGSQGTASYIVKGRGNMKSFCSSSHGSGRTMGRGEATRKLNLEEQMKILDDQEIVHDMRSKDKLDEAPGSYKDIENIISQQYDLINPIVRLLPLANIKG
jgi:tRNA-splicing ligase RtcB (3'-phosphate/5'-hydroxy nucleic acid ligase)